jgi:predicted nucleic acid-binding protein
VGFACELEQQADRMVAARQSGRRIETADAGIAATALLYHAPLLTHNKSDYAGVSNLQFSPE